MLLEADALAEFGNDLDPESSPIGELKLEQSTGLLGVVCALALFRFAARDLQQEGLEFLALGHQGTADGPIMIAWIGLNAFAASDEDSVQIASVAWKFVVDLHFLVDVLVVFFVTLEGH